MSASFQEGREGGQEPRRVKVLSAPAARPCTAPTPPGSLERDMMELTNSSSSGLGCIHGFHEWKDLDVIIMSDPTHPRMDNHGTWWPGEMVWKWLCPVTGEALRTEPFAYPPDMPTLAS